MKTKITLFALFLIGLVISVRVNAQDLVVTNRSICDVDVTFSSLDYSTCTIASSGPTTVNAGATVTLPGPLSGGFVYKAQGKIGLNACSVYDCTLNITPSCNPPGIYTSVTCTIPTTACGSPAPTITLTAAPVGFNSTLVIN
jgi:hypothetical protein